MHKYTTSIGNTHHRMISQDAVESEESFGCLSLKKNPQKCTDSGGHILGPVRFQEPRSKVISVMIDISFFIQVFFIAASKNWGESPEFHTPFKRWKFDFFLKTMNQAE